MQHKIKILVNGAYGRMGQETVKAIEKDSELELVAKNGSHDDLESVIHNVKPEIVVDFTTPNTAFNNAKIIIESNVHPVIGTTGLTSQEIQELQSMSKEKQLGGIIAPNFSIGAILMMKMSETAAKFFNHVEIIEMHHENKKDAPSGTAIKTAEMIAAVKQMETFNQHLPARGLTQQNIQIHSLRLPGFVANQQVIFGNLGETLTIKHDTIDRQCFMTGVILACKKTLGLKELVYGLDKILFEHQ
jgi:4-hydroxy-tetrahydrodipicolinate reductase